MPSPPDPRFAASGSARLAWEAEGHSGHGRHDGVLLLHAGVNDRRSWGPLVEVLAPDHRCVRYDRRGYGETTYSPELHQPVDDALAVLDAAEVDRAAVVGCSMGGMLAVDLALEHPDRVGALVLIGAVVSGGPWPDEPAESSRVLDEQSMAAEEAGDLDEVNRIEAWHWLDGPLAEEGRVAGPARDLFLAMNRIWLESPPAGEQEELPEAWDRLDRLAVPTLVLVGDLDEEELQAFAGPAAEAIPGATLERLQGTAHLPHLEGHARCLEVIADVL